MAAGARTFSPDERDTPRYVVWELTTLCDHACGHCGSRAATARDDELQLDELLAVAEQLARLKTREITLIGGEAYLHPGLLPLVRRLSELGIRSGIQTGGWAVTPQLCAELRAAGLRVMGFSVDGTEATHDRLRAKRGSHAAALRGLDNARAAGLAVSVNTQVNQLTLPVLRETGELFRDLGVTHWRCQLTVPMGRAADEPDLILQPPQILELIDTLGELQIEFAEQVLAEGREVRETLSVLLGNNVGYYSPYALILRSDPGGQALQWVGCQAGVVTMSIESDGTLKPCPSLPTAPYRSGNVRDLDLETAWAEAPGMNFIQARGPDELWGFCAECEFGEQCGAGCSFTAHCTLGRRGNMPFCYHRAATLRERGEQERLVHVLAAIGERYDFGRFELVREPIPS